MVAGIRAAVAGAKLALMISLRPPHAQHRGMGVPGMAAAPRTGPA
jgi:hypothetical protein